MNDFAKSQLLKYGWSEGKGLGKHENGITEALKPKLKFDTTGIGHQVNNWNNWWETAFNKAANNIKLIHKFMMFPYLFQKKIQPIIYQKI
ncbi:G patch domain-containing protein 4 [Osmia bicornis bicornis]|uniref:G patch domain-containing protein 4 n=1 Tax=Osmia bicornis bicornis TaxID=1437191 RepID=UPI001EAF7BBF|nr:G patch domain-containing protein 4 [Osmia bicornis bicornis]